MTQHRLTRYGLVTILLLIMPFQAAGSEKTITLATCEYPPFYSEQLENRGVITEIIVQAFKRTNLSVNIKFYPFVRALRMAKKGRVDGLYTAWYRKERDQWFVFSDPLPPNEIVFYKHKSTLIPFKTYQDLKTYQIGVVRGYYNPPLFKESTFLNKKEAVDDKENLEGLIRHYHDLILIDEQVARYLIRTRFPEYVNFLEPMTPSLEKIDQHLVISKQIPDHQEKMDLFNQGLKSIKKEGIYKKILLKHGFMAK